MAQRHTKKTATKRTYMWRTPEGTYCFLRSPKPIILKYKREYSGEPASAYIQGTRKQVFPDSTYCEAIENLIGAKTLAHMAPNTLYRVGSFAPLFKRAITKGLVKKQTAPTPWWS